MAQDGFVQALDSDEIYAMEGIPEVNLDEAPIDPHNPGFASLLPALRAVRRGEIQIDVLEAYVAGLAPRLDQAFAQYDDVAAQNLAEMGLAEEQIAQLQTAFEATATLLQEMDQVLGLIERGYSAPDDALLAEAEERLAAVHQEIKAALG